MKFTPFLLFSYFLFVGASAQIPNGYYQNAEGLTGSNLKIALHDIIDQHTSVPYGDLEIYYPRTDKTPGGKVWDMYSYVFGGSQNYEYTYGVHECDAGLQYNSEGDCFNKEHLWPQSYFNQAMPTRSDMHMVVPTDGWVNNKRANFPFGDVTTVTWTSTNGSKLGKGSTYSGYSGSLFEPLDSFKGDIARALFYTATRYYGEDGSWSDWEMANGADLTADAITLLLSWHQMDPVSTKEINRNDSIYTIQNNRNPYIDHPELVECVWGSVCNPILDIDHKPEHKLNFNIENKVLHLLDGKAESVFISTTLGQQLLSLADVSDIDLSELSSGVYVILVLDRDIYTTSKILID